MAVFITRISIQKAKMSLIQPNLCLAWRWKLLQGLSSVQQPNLSSALEKAKNQLLIEDHVCSLSTSDNRALMIIPGKTAQEYFSAGADYDITLVQNAISKTTESAQIIATGKKHKRHLQQFKAILPYILPPEEISYPVLFHLDLNPYNTFVDSADPTKVSCIIDWQPPFAAPLLLQAKYPSLSYYDTPCPLLGKLAEMAGLVGEYPDPHLDGILMDAEFANTKPPTLREFYELSSMMGNPTLSKLLSIKDENKQPVLARAADADPDLLQPLLIHIHKRWNRLMEQWQSTAAGGEDQPRPTIPCPISFSKEEINEFRRGTKKNKNMDKSTVSMPLHCLSSDGCLPNEEYEAIVRILKNL